MFFVSLLIVVGEIKAYIEANRKTLLTSLAKKMKLSQRTSYMYHVSSVSSVSRLGPHTIIIYLRDPECRQERAESQRGKSPMETLSCSHSVPLLIDLL